MTAQRPAAELRLRAPQPGEQVFDGFPLARKETVQRDGKPAWTQELIDFQATTPSATAFAKP
jgi:hypothetical protein